MSKELKKEEKEVNIKEKNDLKFNGSLPVLSEKEAIQNVKNIFNLNLFRNKYTFSELLFDRKTTEIDGYIVILFLTYLNKNQLFLEKGIFRISSEYKNTHKFCNEILSIRKKFNKIFQKPTSKLTNVIGFLKKSKKIQNIENKYVQNYDLVSSQKFFEFKAHNCFEVANVLKFFIANEINGILTEKTFLLIYNTDIKIIEKNTLLFLETLLTLNNKNKSFILLSLLQFLGFSAGFSDITSMTKTYYANIFAPVILGKKRCEKIGYDGIEKMRLVLELLIGIFV